MPLPVEEIISRFVDALNEGRPEPVDAFLDRLGEFDPQTKAGLRRLLFTLDALAPRPAPQGSAQTSWRRLETMLENGAPAPNQQDPVLQSGAAATPPAKTPLRPGRLYTQPATSPQQQQLRPGWLGAVAAAVIAFVLLAALLLVFNNSQNPANPAPQPGASAVAVSPSATPLGVFTPTSGYPYQVKVSQAAADNNQIILNYQVYDPAYAIEAPDRPVLDAQGDIDLIGPDGAPLPKLDGMQSADLNQQTFDASGLSVTENTLTLRLKLSLNIFVDPTFARNRSGIHVAEPTVAGKVNTTPTPPPGYLNIDR